MEYLLKSMLSIKRSTMPAYAKKHLLEWYSKELFRVISEGRDI